MDGAEIIGVQILSTADGSGCRLRSGREEGPTTLITKLAEADTGDETIMAIAGHVSRRMLSRYAHIRTEAKRKALESISLVPAAAVSQIQSESATAVVH